MAQTPATAVTVEIDSAIIDRFAQVSVSGFSVQNLDVAMNALADSAIDALWAEASQALAASSLRLETLAEHDAIRPWREATKQSGLKPSTFRSSVESLSRRLLRDGPLATPIRAVNVYCALSVKHLVPAGGYDADRLETNRIVLRPASPETDSFQPLGGRADDMPLTGNVAVYASGPVVICWSFNHRDAVGSALQPTTSRAVFLSEALTEAGRAGSVAMLQELASVLSAHGADVGSVRTYDASCRAGSI